LISRRQYLSNVTVLPKRVNRLAEIDLSLLASAGIKGVILDLDNTLVSEDDRYLSPGGELWLEKARNQGIDFFVLSNGKRRYRVEFWSARLGMPAFSPAKKPFPKGFKRAFSYFGLPPSQVVVIGDSFHTDGMGALLNGCRWIQVATLPHPPRWWERIAGRWVQFPYPKYLELVEWKPEYD